MPDREKIIKGLEHCGLSEKRGCVGCPYSDECGNFGRDAGMSSLATDALALLREQSPDKDINVPGKWISVKDRLPDNDNEVITAYKIDDEKAMKKRKGKLFVKTGNWTGSRWISVWDEYKSYATEEEVLYWMPLPEPPKEVSE